MAKLAFVLFVLLWPLPAFVLVSVGTDLHQGLSVNWWRALLMGVIAEALWTLSKYRAAVILTRRRADRVKGSNGPA